MVGKVLFVVDGSVPSPEAATIAHGLLPKAAEVLVLRVVPQLPRAWTAWPAFPDAGEDLAEASAYVDGVAHALQALGSNASTKVQFSLLSAAEMDREVLCLAQSMRPDLICLALERGSVTAAIVREAVVPVLVAKLPAGDAETTGRRARRRDAPDQARGQRALPLNPAGAFALGEAGIL